MRKDKEKAIVMRRGGRSYDEISKTLGIPKGTLSGWFAPLHWSNEVKEKNIREGEKKSTQRIIRVNRVRGDKLRKIYEEARIEAKLEFDIFKADSLFIAGLMLYAGEGDKSPKNGLVRLSNTDSRIVLIFKNFVVKYCDTDPNRLRFWVLLYPDHKISVCEGYWEKELGIPRTQFYKSQKIQGRHKTKRLLYGVGNIIIGEKRLKIKVLEWIKLASEELVGK